MSIANHAAAFRACVGNLHAKDAAHADDKRRSKRLGTVIILAKERAL
jgi:hypothetical protein